METNGVTSLRHRNSPSSERFLGLFSQPNPNANGNGTHRSSSLIGDELDEDDVFWTGNFSQSDHKPDSPSTVHRPSKTVGRVDSSGILAALPLHTQNKTPKDNNNNRLLCRKISLPSPSSSSRMIPAIPRRQTSVDRDFLLATSGNFRHSAPVNVPVRLKVKGRQETMSVLSDDDDSDKEMLPPHEIVARGSSQADMTFSVLEGVGRTLKGRDLRQVRNAVWRQTGFLD